MNQTESDLIARSKSGDKDAFNGLFSQSQNYIFNFLFQLTGDAAEADDLTQETFLIAYRKLSDFRSESSLRTWLGKIAVNLFRRRCRRNKRNHNDETVNFEKIKIPSDDYSPERIIIKAELQWCIRHNLQYHIPKKFRIVLILRDLQNFSYREIADILGWSVGLTKTNIYRARKMFRDVFINGKCRAFADDFCCTCREITQL